MTENLDSPATKRDLKEAIAELRSDTKQEFAAVRSDMATKKDLERYATKEYLDRKLEDYPTRVELRRDLNDMAHTILRAVNMQFEAAREESARQARAICEEVRDYVRSLDHRYRDLPRRVSRLETAVFDDES